MIFKYFSDNQIYQFLIGAILLSLSIVFYHFSNKKLSLIFLFIGSLGIGFFIANTDPFLILWDEQYHALVAKHMVENPFEPKLYLNPLLDFDFKDWTANGIWLHKQPLFLWQMALSLKIFGVNELAVRIPSILLHALATLMIYRIGKITYSEKIGYYGALFFTVAYFPLELIVGRYSTDHNDVSFLFYITASFWCWFEYKNSGKIFWVFLIGLFSGAAVLVKWLVGLLIYAVWFVTIIFNGKDFWSKRRSYYPLFTSFIIAFLVFVPWQLFIFYRYPLEAHYEFLYNTKHFFEAVENHGGNYLFHFNAVKDLYGRGAAIPLIYLAGIFTYVKNVKSKEYRVAILSAIIIVYTFYSLASTKMISFCIIISPFAFLGLASLVDSVFTLLKTCINLKKTELFLKTIAIMFVCFFLFNFSKIENNHTMRKPNDNFDRRGELAEMKFINGLKKILGSEKYALFNFHLTLNGHIPVMFYTDYIAYTFIPTEMQLKKIALSKYKIAVVDDGYLPNYVLDNQNILKIRPD